MHASVRAQQLTQAREHRPRVAQVLEHVVTEDRVEAAGRPRKLILDRAGDDLVVARARDLGEALVELYANHARRARATERVRVTALGAPDIEHRAQRRRQEPERFGALARAVVGRAGAAEVKAAHLSGSSTT